jgi:DNA-binding NarL/FixJ family response regulator
LGGGAPVEARFVLDGIPVMSEDSEITILIIDGHEGKRLQLKRSLGTVRGFRITGEAGDGRTAVNKTKNLRPKVVVVDTALAAAENLEITRQIRELLPDTGIMMMASEGCGVDVMALIGAGANAYCSKRATTDQIEMAVRTAASGGAWLDSAIAGRVLQAAAAGAQGSAALNRIQEIKCKLSQRESQVLCLLVEGKSNQEIAEMLTISSETVKTHIRHIIEKLGVHSRTEAAVLAIQEHLTFDMQLFDGKPVTDCSV